MTDWLDARRPAALAVTVGPKPKVAPVRRASAAAKAAREATRAGWSSASAASGAPSVTGLRSHCPVTLAALAAIAAGGAALPPSLRAALDAPGELALAQAAASAEGRPSERVIAALLLAEAQARLGAVEAAVQAVLGAKAEAERRVDRTAGAYVALAMSVLERRLGQDRVRAALGMLTAGR